MFWYDKAHNFWASAVLRLLRWVLPGRYLIVNSSLLRDYRLVSDDLQIKHGTGFWWFDYRTEQIFWSAGMYRLYGWDLGEEVTFDKMDAYVHPDSRDKYEKHAAGLRSIDGGAPDLIYDIVDRSGQRKRLATMATRDGDNHLYGSTRDVTRTRRVTFEEYLSDAELAYPENKYLEIELRNTKNLLELKLGQLTLQND